MVLAVCALAFPLDCALDLSLEVSWVLAADECHFDVLVGVGLKLTGHGLQLDVVSAKIQNI